MAPTTEIPDKPPTTNASPFASATAVERLTALWAFSEAGLGGLMHAFRSPFTGIFVGGMAVILIALIARNAPSKPGVAILSATLIVLIVKGAVSPHSPLPAYLAVGFQGAVGALLFSLPRSWFKISAFFLSVLGLMESSLQKIIVLTLLFGNPLWKAIDVFTADVVGKMTGDKTDPAISGSAWLIGLYIGIYALAGIIIGWLTGRAPEAVDHAAKRYPAPVISLGRNELPEGKKKKRRLRKQWIIGLSFLILLIIMYLTVPAVKGTFNPGYLLLRVVAVIGVWYLLLAPVLSAWLKRFLQSRRVRYQREVAQTLSWLPVFRSLAVEAWRNTRAASRIRRLPDFVMLLIAYSLHYKEANIPPSE